MARFLSPEWFKDVDAASALPLAGADALIIKQVVIGGPDGDVGYLVLVRNGEARITPGDDEDPTPDLTITTNWDTAVAIAQGTLSAERALMDGRLRVAGDLRRLAARASGLAGLDPVPPEVRASTTF
jgi:putative sterol carrier protein